jgi:hypothetical protein
VVWRNLRCRGGCEGGGEDPWRCRRRGAKDERMGSRSHVTRRQTCTDRSSMFLHPCARAAQSHGGIQGIPYKISLPPPVSNSSEKSSNSVPNFSLYRDRGTTLPHQKTQRSPNACFVAQNLFFTSSIARGVL